ncbi:TonB-dependent receptor [Paraburkholderia silviterrae]|uniref:TonB-dependent receptor n=1 Tax=Paraburkholderia silviterrae TaxID=2528715 RepID=A0A4V2ZY76_9BURK|nr:TonB-dependent receptor [Paraburkholderia silviterrae]TDG19092.1 TonB-dependent receptor [Paraburkholderia silviterrae]
MKQRALALAIRRIIWAELALSAAIAVPAFAQSQPPANVGTAAVPESASAPAATSQPGNTAPAAAAAGAGAAAAGPAGAAGNAGAAGTAGTGPVKQLKKFEVTGSLIRQSDKTGFQQVQTVTQKDIQNSGATSVADFLRTTTANSANSWSEGQAGNFAAGAAGIALRGLSEKYTLVLVDGQRVAPFAFYSNSTDSFFDLNTIPLNDIERIEIVKTGAVSQYGSDAIAGVVNIITKHDFRGLQLDGSYGSSISDGAGNGTTKFSALAGFGDLNADRFNVTASASVYHDTGSTLADRDSTSAQDFTNRPGGLSLLAPSYWQTSPNTAQALSGCPWGGAVHPAGSNFLGAAAGLGGTVCSFNTANGMSIAPETTRASAKVHADFKIDDTTTAFADLWESYNQTTTNDGLWNNIVGSPQQPTLAYTPGVGLTPFNNTVPAGSPYNPFGVATPLTYAFPNTVTEKTDANYWRASTGIHGSFTVPKAGDWDWSASYSHSQSNVSNTYTNQLNTAALNNIFQNGTFNFANPSSTPNGLNGLYQDANNQGISKLDTVDATLATPNLYHLPTGDIGIGFGAQFLHESEVVNPGAEYLDGTVLNPNLETVNGQRNVAAVYYQVDIPIIRNLTFSQSGRYDHYSDFGGAFSPRFALRYQPIQQLTMYGSYNRGFRAPTFVENSNSQTLGIQQLSNGTVTTITQGNPDLQPERTRNINLGFQTSPTRTTDFGFDWYKIRVDHVIGEAASPSSVVTNAQGQILYETFPYENLGYLDTNGFEGTFRQALPTKLGTFSLLGDWAYVNQFKLGLPSGPINGAGNNFTLSQPFGGSFPRWKGNTTLNWAYHGWNAALTWEFTGPYTETLTAAAPTLPSGKVGSYSQFNLMVTYTGIKHWTIYGGINNIFNRTPPFDAVFASSALNQTGYDTSLYNYIGRFAQIGATYKF